MLPCTLTNIIVKFDLTSYTIYLGFIFVHLVSVSLSEFKQQIICIRNYC